jgi:receptor protein-tyrosine kinase
MFLEIEESVATSEVLGVVEERYRQIAARCFDSTRPERSQSIAVSGATLGDGTSSVAIGLAIAAARNLGSDVALAETDMQRPQMAHDFGADTVLGLSDYLTSEIELNAVLHETHASKVWILPAGRRMTNPGPLLRSSKFQELLRTLRGSFRTVVIDTPPLLTSPHAAVVAGHTDGVVLVVRAGQTHLHEAARALKAIGPTPVRGVVLNGTRAWLPDWLTRLFGVSRFDID